MTSDVMRWYVLWDQGATVSEVIKAGPFHTAMEAEVEWNDRYPVTNHEIALLDSTKVERHLKEDQRLSDWLKERSY